MLDAIHRAWDRVIRWAQKLRETRFAAIGIFEKIRLKSCLAQWPHLPWTSSTKGTSCCCGFFMRKQYFSHLCLALITAAAPGKYDGARPCPRRNPLEGLLASIVVTSTKNSVESMLNTKYILRDVRVLKHWNCSSATRISAAAQSSTISVIIALCFLCL